MIGASWWVPMVSSAVALWQESGENPAVFCYLIGWSTFANFRSRARAPIPNSMRYETACWNPSTISSSPSMMSKE